MVAAKYGLLNSVEQQAKTVLACRSRLSSNYVEDN